MTSNDEHVDMNGLLFFPKTATIQAHIPRLKSKEIPITIVYMQGKAPKEFPSIKIWSPPIKILRPFRPFICALQLLCILIIHKFTVIYGLSEYLTQVALYITSKISRRPYIVKLRGNHYRVRRILYGERKINKIYDILETHSLRQAKAIIVTSNYLKELAKSLGINARKIFRVHYPVDTQKFRPMDTKPKTDVLFPARLSPEKGAHILLKIARLHPTIEFLFVGAKQMDIRNFPRNAKWVGPQPHSKMPYFYNSAKLVVIPSLSEGGMPQSCLEAFSCGKSVIVTDVSDNKIVKELDLGWVVKRGNMKRLAEAISYALSHPRELKEKGKRARQYSLQFTYKKYGQEVRAAFLFTSGPS